MNHLWRALLRLSSSRFSLSMLPLSLLLLGMSTVFFFVADRGYLYRNTWNPFDHLFGWHSSHNMAIATNLSLSHHFLGFINQSIDSDGNIYYYTYGGVGHQGIDHSLNHHIAYRVNHRFPPGGIALIKLVTLGFGDDLSNQIYAARMFMLVLFVGTAVLAYWSLCRLVSSRWMASTVTLVTFSSTQFLLFNDIIIPERGLDLFGCALVFHGMVIFAQENRFRQLVAKVCLASLLGWHVLALLLTFILLSLIKEVMKAREVKTGSEIFVLVMTSRYIRLGIIALSLGVLILVYNIGIEYYALNIHGSDRLALFDLPSLRRILDRTVLSDKTSSLPGVLFFRDQLARIGLMSVPFIWSGPSFTSLSGSWQMVETQNMLLGIVVVVVCIGGMILMRHRLLAMTAVLAGFVWSVSVREFSVKHEFDAVFYLGISLVFYTSLLFLIRKWLSKRLMPLTTFIALLIFTFSSYRMGYTERNDTIVEFHRSMIDDFNHIRQFTKGKNVLVPVANSDEEMTQLVGSLYGLYYYLAGSHIIFNNYHCDPSLDRVDLKILTTKDKEPGLLTPNNQMMFLYDRHKHEKRIDKLIEEGGLAVQGDFDVYLTDDRKLIYITDRCDTTKTDSSFLYDPIYLLVYPVESEGLPGHEQVDFNFHDYSIIDTQRYIAIIDLPDYKIDSITTGQYSGEDRIWSESFFGPDHASGTDLDELINQASTSRGPIIRDYFDVYLINDKDLIYIKDPCHNTDISDDFFVHVVPAEIRDLPEHRWQYGFDNLDFVFTGRGTTDGRRCAALIKLPDYDIVRIHTGQFTNEGPIWRSQSEKLDFLK